MASNVSQPGSSSHVAVLVVEIQPPLFEGLTRIASLCQGMEVSLAATWPAAFGHLREHRFDVLLVDVDAMEWPALRELTALRAAAPEALLIALTAEPDAEVSCACRSRGADRVLGFDEAYVGLFRLTHGG